jgi:hypothetical protein
MRTSGIPQLSGEVLLVDHEDVDAPTGEFGEELGSGHACRLGGTRHGNPALLIPVNRRGETDLVGDFIGRLAQRRKEAVGDSHVYVGHSSFSPRMVEPLRSLAAWATRHQTQRQRSGGYFTDAETRLSGVVQGPAEEVIEQSMQR